MMLPGHNPHHQKPAFSHPRAHRALAFANLVPPQLAAHFSISQVCVLNLIAREAGIDGQCIGTHDQVAARVGVCNTAVRNTLRKAKKLGFLRHSRVRIDAPPYIANAITIACEDWKSWLSQRPADVGEREQHPVLIELDLIKAFQRQGSNWQDQINAVLRQVAYGPAAVAANGSAPTLVPAMASAPSPVLTPAATEGTSLSRRTGLRIKYKPWRRSSDR